MKKLFSLIKVSLNHDMNLFKINTKKSSKLSKILLPIILTFYLMFIMGMYSEMLIEKLESTHLEFVVLTLFGLVVSIISLLEGIYKSGPLLFNCKDDNLLLSLPIKKSTVLFIRVFKFYIFELMYNTLFILPAMAVYAYHVNPSWTYYLSSLIAIFILPIIPIVLSTIIGFVITFLSTKVKRKSIFQTVFSMIIILFCLYLSYGMDTFITNIALKASSIHEVIMRLYYPVGAYITLVNSFDVIVLFKFIIIHLVIFSVVILILGKVYFKINSSFKKEKISNVRKSNYIIKFRTKYKSFIRKELNRFFSTPVFIMNAGFGLVLFLIACVLVCIKFDNIALNIVEESKEISLDVIESYLPLIMFGLVCFSSLMTSITSSMLSLEGKSLNILKSLPLKPLEIVLYKVLAALVIIVPCIVLGDIIVFLRFGFDIMSMLLILLASIVLPFVTEMIGIMVNLKYPKMDASNDTEIVKQSMSSLVSTFIGMGMLGITGILMFILFGYGLNKYIIMLIIIIIYIIISIILWKLLDKTCDKNFNNINA